MYETIKLFETTDVKEPLFYLNSICIDPDFTFYFGGFNGIDYFIPYKMIIISTNPPSYNKLLPFQRTLLPLQPRS